MQDVLKSCRQAYEFFDGFKKKFLLDDNAFCVVFDALYESTMNQRAYVKAIKKFFDRNSQVFNTTILKLSKIVIDTQDSSKEEELRVCFWTSLLKGLPYSDEDNKYNIGRLSVFILFYKWSNSKEVCLVSRHMCADIPFAPIWQNQE